MLNNFIGMNDIKTLILKRKGAVQIRLYSLYSICFGFFTIFIYDVNPKNFLSFKFVCLSCNSLSITAAAVEQLNTGIFFEKAANDLYTFDKLDLIEQLA